MSTTSLTLNASAVNETTGQSQRADDIVLANETAFLATANGTWVDVGEGRNMSLLLTWLNNAGSSPTLDVTVQTSQDKGVADTARAVNSLSTAGAFAQKTTSSGTQRKEFGPTARYVRIVATIGGTASPSYDFSVVGKVN
jgi:hypothetical protein